MGSRLKIGAVIVGLALGLSGCATHPQESAREAQTSDIVPVVQPQAAPIKPTQLVTPSDIRVAAAMNEALPIIGKVLGIHRCVKDAESVRLMNRYAVPSVNLATGAWYTFPNNKEFMKYHDLNKCVSVSTLDNWTMPALNALQFRAVYFADDSGETVNFQYLFKKVDDGSWELQIFQSNVN